MIDPGRTRLLGLLAAGGSVAAAGALLLTPVGRHAAMPGPLSSNHAQLADDCGACHAQAADALQTLAHGTGASAMDLDQSERCRACHELGAGALAAHGWTADERRALDVGQTTFAGVPSGAEGELACATCHFEHGGRGTELAALADGRCQVCHAERFDGFAGHAPFEDYPQTRKTRIGFDHTAHLLRYFVEDRPGDAPESCTACHTLDPSGEHMPIRGYEASCAACHDEDVVGPLQVDGAGIAVLGLPALDTLSLEEAGIGIGRWPADAMIAETGLSPFLRLLLAADDADARDLEALADVDLLDLMDADADVLATVGRLAWSIKALYLDVVERGHAAVVERLERATGVPIDAEQASRLLLRLPEDLVQGSLEAWLPDLADEVRRHADGLDVPTDASLPATEPDLDGDARHEAWVATGGWYASELDFSIRYRPGGHADAFLGSWIDLGAASARPAARALFDVVAAPDAVGRCTKCHAVEAGEGLRVRWSGARAGYPQPDGGGGLDRFSHVAHFASPSDNACLACHVLARDAETDYPAAFASHDPATFVPGFEPLTIETCATCHDDTGAGSGCLTCHDYHAHRVTGTTPRAALDALRR